MQTKTKALIRNETLEISAWDGENLNAVAPVSVVSVQNFRDINLDTRPLENGTGLVGYQSNNNNNNHDDDDDEDDVRL